MNKKAEVDGREEDPGGAWRVRTRILRAGLVVATFLMGLLFGRYNLATIFAPYDDEGHFLLSLEHYLAGEHLYTEVFSQYGPFYFYFQSAFFRLLPVNHDAGRLVTLICWLLSATLAGYFVYKLSNNLLLASAAGLASMSLARVLSSEPGHPQQVILPMLMAACYFSATSGRIGLLFLGAIGAALLFTKINVGVFYFAALAYVLVCLFPAGRIRTIGAGFVLVYAVGGPMFLMRQDLLGWAHGYCLLAILCGVSTLLVGLRTTQSCPRPMRSVLYTVTGAVLVAALVVIETKRQGMPLSTLLDGVLWASLRQPGVFEIPLEISNWAILMSVLVSGCFAGVYWFRERCRAHTEWVNALRCVAGLCTIALLGAYRVPFALAFLPLGLIPVKGGVWGPSDYFPRLFITGLAATQFLQAYPVAGSQLSIASAPLLLWAFICVHDGAGGLFSLVRRGMGWLWMEDGPLQLETVLGGLVALAVVASWLLVFFRSGAWLERYPTRPSSLRGAASLHLPAQTENLYQFLASNIRANCDVLCPFGKPA